MVHITVLTPVPKHRDLSGVRTGVEVSHTLEILRPRFLTLNFFLFCSFTSAFSYTIMFILLFLYVRMYVCIYVCVSLCTCSLCVCEARVSAYRARNAPRVSSGYAKTRAPFYFILYLV